MASATGNRKRTWTALAAVVLVAFSGLACVAARPLVFPPAPAQCVWDGIERVVAVGDLHGDFDAFVKILGDSKLIDQDRHWTGGTSHLVQVGDVADRGDNARQIYVLLSQLEREASSAGGRVHFLAGNHEEMNLARVSMDYAGYVTRAQFKEFVHGDYRRAHERRAERMSLGNADMYWDALMRTDGGKTEYYDGYRDAVGPWITGHNVIVKINGVVFVHGGISIEESRRSLESINARFHQAFVEMIRDQIIDQTVIFQQDGPLWFRKLDSNRADSLLESDVKQILSNLGAKRIVVGHSPTTYETAERYGGLVWIIDSFISSAYDKIAGFHQRTSIEVDREGNITHYPKGGFQNGTKTVHSYGGVPEPRDPVVLLLQLRLLPAPGRF